MSLSVDIDVAHAPQGSTSGKPMCSTIHATAPGLLLLGEDPASTHHRSGTYQREIRVFRNVAISTLSDIGHQFP